MKLYFILDCKGNIVGNPKGYRTIRGAIREQDKKGSKAYQSIWRAYWKEKLINPEHTKLSKICAYNCLDDSVKGLLGYSYE